MDEKTFVFPEGRNDMSTLLAMMNGGGFGNGSWMWIIFLFFLYGWGGRNGFGFGDSNSSYDKELLMQAISGNGSAISQLATNLNTDVTAIQTAINSVNTAIQSVGNQVGLSSAQVVNAMQLGNQSIASQIASCCCENKQLVQAQGYENQIATLNQTNQLGSKMDTITSAIANQTVEMNNQFCALKERELQNKIDSLTATNTALQNSISNANQTASINAYVASLVTPLQTEVAAIKAAQPSTTTVQWPNLTAVPTYYANALCGYGFNNSVWS